jgi:hypothetical protein
MRSLIPFRALLRPSTRNDGLHRRVVRQIGASLGTQAKTAFVFLLAGSLWNFPCSATLAAEPANFQHIVDPAYNRDRGPVSIFALRVHAEF